MNDEFDGVGFFLMVPESVARDSRLTRLQQNILSELYTFQNAKPDQAIWIGNQNLGDRYGVRPDSVSKAISKLEEYGYIKREIKYKENSKQVEKRLIWVLPIGNQAKGVLADEPRGSRSTDQEGIGSSPKENIPINIPDRSSGGSKAEPSQKNELKRVIAYYQENDFEMPNSVIMQDINYEYEDLTELNKGNEEEAADMIIYALKQAALNGVLRWKYAKSVIERHIKQHHTTAAVAEKADEDAKRRYSPQGSGTKQKKSVSAWQAIEDAVEQDDDRYNAGPF